MIQSRTHNCNELRIGNVGERVTLVGWFENMRKVSKNLGFVILRDFYGTTQLVVETEEMMNVMDGINKGVHDLRGRCGQRAFQQKY